MTHASPRPARAFIGLGGNLDSPRPRLLAAFEAIAALPGVRLIARSSLYASSPVGLIDQPDFINAVALVETTLPPQALLDALLALEREAGRVRDVGQAERVRPRRSEALERLVPDTDVACEGARAAPPPAPARLGDLPDHARFRRHHAHPSCEHDPSRVPATASR